MTKVVTPIVCTVVNVGKPKESTFTLGHYYYPVLFADQSYPEGDEQAKVWKNMSADEVSQIQKGDIVQLVPNGNDKNGNPKHQIVKLTPAPSREEQAVIDHHTRTLKVASGEWSDDYKREMAVQITQNAKLMRFCLETVKAQFSDLLESEDSLRCVATTLFLQTVK